MKLTVGNITALVSDASEDDERWLREYLAFEDAGAKFRRRFRKSGDGRLLLYNLWRHSFPAGLVSTVLRGAAEIGLAIEVVDGRARPCEPDPAADLGWLRDYQRAAVDACLKQTVGIVKSVTGSGKTEMFIALTRALPCRWLMLVHRTTLVRQAAERYELRTGEQAGIVSEGHWDDAPRFVCASFQTVLAGLRSTDAAHRARTTALLEGVQGVIVDEAHVVPAATTRAILTKAKHAYWRFGFSGTPLDRGDQRSIFAVAVLGPIIHEVNGRELVAAGVESESLLGDVWRLPRVRPADQGAVQFLALELLGLAEERWRSDILLALRREGKIGEIRHGLPRGDVGPGVVAHARFARPVTGHAVRAALVPDGCSTLRPDTGASSFHPASSVSTNPMSRSLSASGTTSGLPAESPRVRPTTAKR